jgi:NDP-hexose-3-ketoreductase
VWGLGRHARNRILGALRECPATELRGVCTRNAEVLAEEASKHGCEAWQNADEMLGVEDIDVVFVATPIGLHHAHGEKVLAAGKHLWMEKPFAANLEQTEDLLALSRDKQLAACEGFMHAWHPQFARLIEIVRAPDFGRVVSLTCRFALPQLEHPGFRTSRDLGGSALLDVGSYPVSAVLGVAGEDSFEVRTARVNTPAGSGQVDESGYALLEFPDGATAHLEWGYGCGYRNEITVLGEHGSVYTDRIFSKPDGYEARFLVRNETGDVSGERLAPSNAFVEMFSAFAAMLGDRDLAEQERARIARHASALDRIREFAS